MEEFGKMLDEIDNNDQALRFCNTSFYIKSWFKSNN